MRFYIPRTKSGLISEIRKTWNGTLTTLRAMPRRQLIAIFCGERESVIKEIYAP